MSDKHSAIFGKAKDEYEAGRWSKARAGNADERRLLEAP